MNDAESGAQSLYQWIKVALAVAMSTSCLAGIMLGGSLAQIGVFSSTDPLLGFFLGVLTLLICALVLRYYLPGKAQIMDASFYASADDDPRG